MPASRGRIVLALAAATSLSLLGDMMMYTVLPTHHAALGIGVGAVGILLSIHRVIRLGANGVAGLLYDRCGRRGPLLVGLGLAVAATGGYLLAGGFWPLLGARLVWGVAFALISVGGLAVLLDLTTPVDRGRTVGRYHALVQVGTMLALLLAGGLMDAVGYRATLAVLGPLTALGWLIAWAAVPETAAAVRGGRISPARPPLLAVCRALDVGLLAPFYASFATFFAGNGVLMATVGLHLRSEAPGIPAATLTGILLALRKLAQTVVAPTAGALADRMSRRRVAAVGMTVGVAGFGLLVLGHGLTAAVVGVALTAVGEGIVQPAVSAWAGDLTPASARGLVVGGLVTAGDLGAAIGPLAGYALGAGPGLRWAYALCAAGLLTALAVLAIAGRATRPRRAEARDTGVTG